MAVGCDSSANHIDGIIAGVHFRVLDAVSYHPAPGEQRGGTIVLSNVSGFCAGLEAGTTSDFQQRLELLIWQTDAAAQPIAPNVGTYTLVTPDETQQPDGKFLLGNFTNTGGHCVVDRIVELRAGSRAVLTRADAGGYTGTVDLVFASGEHASGAFDTRHCAALATYDSQPPACSE